MSKWAIFIGAKELERARKSAAMMVIKSMLLSFAIGHLVGYVAGFVIWAIAGETS